MQKQSKIAYFFISMLFFICFDLYFSNLILNYAYTIPENNFIDIVFVPNMGAAFSLLEGAKIFLVFFAIAAASLITIYALKNISKLRLITVFMFSLLSAGIITNMYERIAFGYVRDYIKLNFIDFPVFNISDIFINLSVFCIVIIILWNKYARTNENNN